MSTVIRRVLWMPLDHQWQPAPTDMSHCCEAMATAVEHTCDMHKDPFECADTPLVYHDIFGEYGIPVRDGGMSYLVLAHCPWCGAKLPESRRDDWFDAIDAADLTDTETAKLPADLRTGAWRRAAKS